MSRLNVLVLHQMGDPRKRREAVRSLEYMLPESRSDINCLVHDAALQFPETLKEVNYHLIVLGPTFLCFRHNSRSYRKALKNYDFIKQSDACKVALPQDDYDSSGVLDDWMCRWKVDRVYSVIPDYWDVLYPNYCKSGEIVLGYTGYIAESWIDSWIRPKPHSERSIDVSYRTHDASINRCYLRNLKYVIADRFVNAITEVNCDLNLDISNRRTDLIPGTNWHQFIEDSKFCLTTPSGSSLLDPEGAFKQQVMQYSYKYSGADFNELADKVFMGNDREFIYSAISPRNIEAALAETVQIATPGSYSGLMYPMKHYIPIEEDCSNIRDVVEMMSDLVLVEDIKRQCKEVVLGERRLRRKVIVDEIIHYAESIVSERNVIGTQQDRVDRLFREYQEKIEQKAKLYWHQQRVILSIAEKLGVKKLKQVLTSFNSKF